MAGDIPRHIFLHMNSTRRSGRNLCADVEELDKEEEDDDDEFGAEDPKDGGDDEHSQETHETCSQLPPSVDEMMVSEMKRKLDAMTKENDAMKKENARLSAQEPKRARRGPKQNLERGNAFVPLQKIVEQNRLSTHKMYSVCKLVRTEIFCYMKYFGDTHKKRCLERCFNVLGMHEQDVKDKYRDFIVCYVEQKTTSQRNNAIFALKNCVLGNDGEGKFNRPGMSPCLTSDSNACPKIFSGFA